MVTISAEQRTAFRQQGFVVIPEVLSAEQIADGREMVAALLERQPHADDHVGPYFLWPRFAAEGHPLLDFYRETGVGARRRRGRSARGHEGTPEQVEGRGRP
ncbi:hypothetical protein ACN6K4_006721 [Streptomyces hayashii]|uniref:hypothetical protein n=1 Tax=Streptomyces hayashii TaxID=2839966 RepID=UPI00403D36D5